MNCVRLSVQSVLQRVGRMPITSWSYKGDLSSVRHIGPMAQDFYKAFALGLDDRHKPLRRSCSRPRPLSPARAWAASSTSAR